MKKPMRSRFPVGSPAEERPGGEPLFQPGTVTVITFAHDLWCPMLNGGDECKCDPDVFLNGRKVEVPIP